MSQRALLLAVRDYLRSSVNLADDECEVMFDGQPMPMAGERFVSVWPGDWSARDIEGLDEEYGINITVTRRVTYAPADRVVAPLTGTDAQALDQLLEAIRAKLHLDSQGDKVLNAANTIIGTGSNGFVEPLRFRHGSRPEPKGPDWFSADGESEVSGLAQTLTFGGARRLQTIESET